MIAEVVKNAEMLAAKVGYVFISTSDLRGRPHVAVAGRLASVRENHILVTEWFCPGTMNNLQVNPRISVVVWNPSSDSGYQILGELEEVKELGMLDGYSLRAEYRTDVPQVERQLLIHIDKILEFRRAPHSDVVISELEGISSE